MDKGFSILNTLMLYTGHIIASYCFKSLIGLPNICFQPYPSCYKFYILKDEQENIEVTIICHLAAFI